MRNKDGFSNRTSDNVLKIFHTGACNSSMVSHILRRRSLGFCVTSFLIVWCFYRSHPHQTPSDSLTSTITKPGSKTSLQEIPHNIWQIFLGSSLFDRLGDMVQSWVMKNQDFSYVLVRDDGANSFVKEHYSERPDILHTYQSPKYPIFRCDLLRYMLLEAKGGVYSDVDTTTLKPIRE